MATNIEAGDIKHLTHIIPRANLTVKSGIVEYDVHPQNIVQQEHRM